MWLVLVGLGLLASSPQSRAQTATEARRTPVVSAVQRATPGVVAIEVVVPQYSPFLFGGTRAAASEGSGVIIDADGVVLTNAHVVENASAITVHQGNGHEWPAELVALDRDLDLAVLRLQGASDLPTVLLGNSDTLMLGETAIAIGNPYGLELTVSTGVVSSILRDVEIADGLTQSYIQTDAAINPGNSGGALVNLNGELIGINTFIHSQAEGIGFAIPVNRARKVATDLLNYGTVQTPWLGVDLEDLGRRQFRGTPLDHGAMRVVRVHVNSPAQRADLRVGDLMYRLEGHDSGTIADLNAHLGAIRPGATVRLGIVRDGRSLLEVDLRSIRIPEEMGALSMKQTVGIEARETNGFVVVTAVHPNGSWAAAKLRNGDAILAVDGQRITSVAELTRLLVQVKAKHRATALFTIQRGPHRGNIHIDV